MLKIKRETQNQVVLYKVKALKKKVQGHLEITCNKAHSEVLNVKTSSEAKLLNAL